MPLTLSKLVATKTGLKTDDIPRNNDTQLWIKLQTNQHKRCLCLRWFRRRTANEQSLMSHCLQSEASIEIGRGGQGRSPQHQLGFYFVFDWRRIQWKCYPECRLHRHRRRLRYLSVGKHSSWIEAGVEKGDLGMYICYEIVISETSTVGDETFHPFFRI